MSAQKKKKRTEDNRAFIAEVKRAQAADENKLALQPTHELGHAPVGSGTISFVNVSTAIGPSQTSGVVIPDTTPPAQVLSVVVTAPLPAALTVSWIANTETDLNHYNVYRGTTSGFAITVGSTVPTGTPTTNSFNDTGLSNSTTYYYRVLAVDNSVNYGQLSVQAQGTTQAVDTTPPAQTVGLAVTAVSSSQLNLTWTASTASDFNHYKVYRGTSSGFIVTPGVTTPNGTPTTNSFSDTGLLASTTYYYKVLAADHTGNLGTLSAQAQGTTQTPVITAPAQVTGLTATPYGQGFSTVFLMWNPNTEPDLDHYNIYRGTTPGFTVTPGVTVPFDIINAPNTDNFPAGGAYTPSTTYYFKVAAVDTGGDIGPRSTEVSVAIPAMTTLVSTFYLPFNGDISDFGPNSLDMQAYHINGFVKPGKFGSHGLRLNYPSVVSFGSVDQLNVDKFRNSTLIQMDTTVGFSVAFWIYPSTLSALPYRRVLVEKPDEPTQKWTLQVDSAGILYFFVKKAGIIYKRQVSGFTTGAWQHVAAVFNAGTNTLEVYRNGVAGVNSTATPQWPGTVEGDPINCLYIIGTRLTIPSGGMFLDPSDGGNADTMFQGYMDEFLWYRSYLLSQAEITSLVNSNVTNTSGGGIVPPPLVPNLWLKLDGNYNDSSGFGNTVTPSNVSGFAGSGQFGTNSVRLNTPTAGLDNISVTTNTNVEIDLVNGCSWSFWIFPQSTTSNQFLFSKRIDSNNYITAYLTGSDVFGDSKEGGVTECRLAGTVTQNAWNHIAITYTGTILRMYVNGTPPLYPPVGVSPNTAPTTTNNLIIGNLSGSTDGTKVFRGRIDEFQYFKGAILDQGEVNNLMNTNTPQ